MDFPQYNLRVTGPEMNNIKIQKFTPQYFTIVPDEAIAKPIRLNIVLQNPDIPHSRPTL